MTTTATHKITWWVYAGTERIRHTSTMRGQWGYDVSCSCGWETRTGGATRKSISDEIWFHKRIDADGPQLPFVS